ncbi:hypothetical protein ACFLQ0_01460 [Nitrospinota bacterium]
MRKIFALLGSVAIIALLAGCETTTTTWVKTGVGMKQATKDLEACSDAAGLLFDRTGLKGAPVAYSSRRSYDAGVGMPFEKCIKGKGYKMKK